MLQFVILLEQGRRKNAERANARGLNRFANRNTMLGLNVALMMFDCAHSAARQYGIAVLTNTCRDIASRPASGRAALLDRQIQLERDAARPKNEDARKTFGRGGPRRPQWSVVIPWSCRPSTTPVNTSPTPIADTKKPTIRLIASMPIGPMRSTSFPA